MILCLPLPQCHHCATDALPAPDKFVHPGVGPDDAGQFRSVDVDRRQHLVRTHHLGPIYNRKRRPTCRHRYVTELGVRLQFIFPSVAILMICMIIRKCDHKKSWPPRHDPHLFYVTNAPNAFCQNHITSRSFNHVANALIIKIGRFHNILIRLLVFRRCHHQNTNASSNPHLTADLTAKVAIFSQTFQMCIQLLLGKWNHWNRLTCVFLDTTCSGSVAWSRDRGACFRVTSHIDLSYAVTYMLTA